MKNGYEIGGPSCRLKATNIFVQVKSYQCVTICFDELRIIHIIFTYHHKGRGLLLFATPDAKLN